MRPRVPDRRARQARLNEELERITRVLAAQADVEKVIVFGSAARGDVNGRSDLDLMVVQRTGKRFLDRLDEMYRLLVPRVACDLLVYTPEELVRLRRESRFVARALLDGKVVHAA